MKLFKERGYATEGDRILVLGEDLPGKTDGLGSIHITPGERLWEVAGEWDGTFSALLLGPMAPGDDDDEDVLSKNNSSVIMQVSVTGDGQTGAGVFMFGGDAEVAIWERVWQAHRYSPANLAYDVLIAPHHCSWHSLSWDSWSDYGESAVVSADARNALSQTRPGAVVVSSSAAIVDDNNDPPCIRAKREYEAIVAACNGEFRCVADTPVDEPLVMEIGRNGPKFVRVPVARAAAATTGVGSEALPHG